MTRAIVKVAKRSLTSGIPSRVEMGYAEELPGGELELHIEAGHVARNERLIVEAADEPEHRKRLREIEQRMPLRANGHKP